MVKNKSVKKERQITNSTTNKCQLALSNKVPTEQLLCCSDNNTCTSQPQVCPLDSNLVTCHKINLLEPCSRNDETANEVCQHKTGIFCVNGEQTVYKAGENNKDNAIAWIMGRSKEDESYSDCYARQWGTIKVACPDLFSSGTCSLLDTSSRKTSQFSYQVEVCDNSTDHFQPSGTLSSVCTPTTISGTGTQSQSSQTNYGAIGGGAGGGATVLVVLYLIYKFCC